MKQFKAGELRDLVANILVACGAPRDSAQSVADVLIENNLAGHDSHGVLRISQYVKAVEQGAIVPTAHPEIVRETPSTALITGNWTFGQVSALFATQVLIQKAASTGVAAVAVVDAGHCGRLAAFTERGVEDNVAIFMTTGSGAGFSTVPFGGTRPALGTNPFGITVPRQSDPPVTLDFATSIIAAGKIKVALSRDEQLPKDHIVDKDGNPTTDPAAYYDGGSLLPFGGHKGYALSVMAELLAGPLTGADQRGDTTRRRTGIFAFGIRLNAFDTLRRVDAGIEEVVNRITSVDPAPGFERVMLPGEPEWRAREDRRKHGIPLPDKVWRDLAELARRLGVSLDLEQVEQ